jgi:proteasome lid subunit RPN8/RPN11
MAQLTSRDLQIYIQPQHMSQMTSHVDKENPLEACGLVAGLSDKSLQVFPIKNILKSPAHYQMDPKEQISVFMLIEERGWDLLAIYHSHPIGLRTPSQTDIEEAYYPDTIHLIFSLINKNWKCLAYVIQDKDIQELEIILSS